MMRIETYLRTVDSFSARSSLPIVASCSAPVSPTSIRFLCVKSKVTPSSGDCTSASEMCMLLSEVDGKGGEDELGLPCACRGRTTTRSPSCENMETNSRKSRGCCRLLFLKSHQHYVNKVAVHIQ